MRRLIDANELNDFFFSETSGTEEIIRDLMSTHGLDYANHVNEDSVMDFAIDLLKKVQNVIDTQPTAYDPDKVVEQLKKCAKGNCIRNSDSGRCPYIGNSEIDCEKCTMLRAIEIVKAGGGRWLKAVLVMDMPES